MPYHLNQDEIDSCRKSFEEFDADRSGTIDETELGEILSGEYTHIIKNIIQ